MVRIALGLMCCLFMTGADLAPLHELAETGRFFDIRRALEGTAGDSGTLFYRAIAAARFGRDAAAIEQLRRVLDTHPSAEIERRAHEELAYTLVRGSRYADAAAEFAATLQLMPADDSDRADVEDDRAFCEVLRATPVQSVEIGPDVPVKARRRDQWLVPVSVNGNNADWIFDTGANDSVVTESEAIRIGLSVLAESTWANGSTGKRNQVRVGVAKDLRLGRALLHNVAFAIIPTKSLPPHAPGGILGLPVMRALGSVSISSRGLVRIEPNPAVSPHELNLFFDALTPVVEVRHGGRVLQMALDTGASRSYLYPSFRPALTEDETRRLRKQHVGRTGVGETLVQTLDVAPKLDLALSGKIVQLHGTALLPAPLKGIRYEDGVIGMDALAGGFVLDFKRMQLRLDEDRAR